MVLNTLKILSCRHLQFLWVGMVLLIPQVCLGQSGKLPDVNLNPDGISSSAECGKCHKNIYTAWKNSLHSESADNSVFWAAYLQSHYEDPEAAEKLCFSCHAPVAQMNGDLKLKQKISREGVSCDFCHSIEKLQWEDGRVKYKHAFGLVKQGPLKNASSPVHKTQYNELFQQSRFCGGCHEYKSANGVKVIETFSEWQQSPYPKKGIHCQNCHMRKIKGKIVDPEVLKTPQETISSHDIAGGHSLTMRKESLGLRIGGLRQYKQKLVVVVEITNEGAGHKIPTGLPSKKIILQVAVKSRNGEDYQVQQKIYRKLIVDESGTPVILDADLLLGRGTRVVSDNRIGPLETRREEFMFFVPENEVKKVVVTVFYNHEPKIVQASRIHIKMKEVSEWINR